MRRYIVLFVFGLLVFGLTFFVAFNFFYGKRDEFVSSELEKARVFREISENKRVTETSFEEEKIGINTELIIEEVYSKCNHSEEVVSQVDNNMVNLTESEFKKEYPNFEVESFSKKQVKVKERVEGVCNQHFKIAIGEDFIEVFKLNQNEEDELYMVTNISRDYLDQRDINKLQRGIEVFGRDNINSKLEDYE